MGNAKDRRLRRRALRAFGESSITTPKEQLSVHTPNKAMQEPQVVATHSAIELHKHIPALWRVVIYLLGLAATAIGIWSAYPRVSVTPGDLLSSTNPLSSTLTVSNDGQFGVNSVSITCADAFIDYSEHIYLGNSLFHQATDLPLGDIDGGGHVSTQCVNPTRLGTPLKASMTVIVSFRPTMWPWFVKRSYYLRTLTDSDRQLHWILTAHP
jgi:hypothetical protein